MVRPNYLDFINSSFVLAHSAKGTTWEDHKYIKRVDGTYYYPDSYEGGRHLPEDGGGGGETEPPSISELSQQDIENLAREVIRGSFGNGQVRKDLLGEDYAEVQKRVNEILGSSAGSKKVSEATEESIKKAETAASNVSSSSKVHSGVNMEQVLRVYKNKKKGER